MATSRLASAVEGVHSGDSGQVSGHVGALPVTTSEVVIGPEALMNHAGALDSLLKVTHAPATARWLPVVTWMRHNPMQTPWSVLVRRDGEVVAAALLVRVFRRGVYRFETPCEGYLPSWLPSRDAHSAKALAVALARSLRAIRNPWVLHLRCLELADPAVAAITEELAVTHSDNGVSPRINFSSGEPLTAYLSRNTRSALAKAHNRIKNAGLAIEMRWTRELEEIDAIVPEVLRLYRKRSSQLGHDVALLANADYRSYLADVVHSYGEAGLARLLTLRLNGQLASYALCLESAGTMLVYSNRMSPDWARYSAGAITNAEVVRTAHSDRGIRCLDWGTGLQRYKLSGDATLHPHQNIHAWSSEMARGAWVWTQRARQIASSGHRIFQRPPSTTGLDHKGLESQSADEV